MANNIGLITKYATEAWDKVYKKVATSSVLDGEKKLMKFIGVKTVRIAKHSSSGLGWYGRANKPVEGPYAAFDAETAAGSGYGYPTGDADLYWETFEIRIDRARQLRIELFDNEESGELAVTSALTDFSRTKVAPEVDSYVYSTLAKFAGTIDNSAISLATGMGYNANGPFQKLNNAFMTLEENEVPEEDQIVFATPYFINLLRSSGEVVKVLHQNEYKENVDFSVYEYMGRKIISVPSSRMRTDIMLNADGYGWGSNSKKINFIVCAKEAVYHVTKYDKIRVFDPKMVQDFDGYKINVRVYHDCFVPDNKRIAVYAHIDEDASTPTAPQVLFVLQDQKAAAAGVPAQIPMLTSVAINPGDLLIDGLYVKTTAAPAIGTPVLSAASADFDNELVIGTDCFPVTPYTNLLASGSGLSAGTAYYLFAVRDSKVVAVAGTSFTITSIA